MLKIKSFNYQRYKYHVVGVINDGDTELYIVKYWRKYNHHYWVYEVWERWELEDGIECKLVKNIKYEK